MSRVSIYMSSYNYAKYLPEAIKSVLNQTFTDFELFIIDDASTDESWQIIQGFSDPRIKAYRNNSNQNSKQWMNKIIFEMSSGEYFAVHHSDNIWEPEKLQKQVNFLDLNSSIGAVFTNAKIIDEQGRPFNDTAHFYYDIFEQPNRNRFEWLNYFFYRGNALCHPSILIRKTCYDNCGGYRNGLVQIPDLDMWIRLCMKYEIHIFKEKLVQFRVLSNENFTSGNLPKNRIRYQFELSKVLSPYKSISCVEDLLKIFPECPQYINDENPDILYAMGRIATEFGNDMSIKLFGLNLLFDALNDSERARNLEIYQNFNHKTFIEFTAQYDIFSIYSNYENNQRINKLEQEVLFYSLSKSWRITRPLRKLKKLLRGVK